MTGTVVAAVTMVLLLLAWGWTRAAARSWWAADTDPRWLPPLGVLAGVGSMALCLRILWVVVAR